MPLHAGNARAVRPRALPFFNPRNASALINGVVAPAVRHIARRKKSRFQRVATKRRFMRRKKYRSYRGTGKQRLDTQFLTTLNFSVPNKTPNVYN